MEIFDGAGVVNQNEVEKFRKNFLKLFRPRANFGAKEKVELQNFVLEGHPNGFPCMGHPQGHPALMRAYRTVTFVGVS